MEKNFFEGIRLESLVQFIEETADASLRQEVERWIEADPHHASFFDKFKSAWTDIDSIRSLTPEVIDQDWQYILGHIETTRNVSLPSRKLWYQNAWLYAAATVMLAVSVAGGYFLGRSSKPVITDNTGLVYNEIVVPKGEKSQLILSDGTKVWVNAGSTLRFPNRFGTGSREVWLEGEAFFDVAKSDKVPFYVHTSDLNIKVLGTKFNVKAYQDEGIVETTLVEGLVSLERKGTKKSEQKEVFLQPNHKAIYIRNDLSLITEEVKREISEPLQPKKIIISNPVHVEVATSWKEGKLIFEDESLESILKKLERRYDVEITVEDESINEVKYSGVLKNVSVEQAIKAIQVTSDFRFDIKGDKIKIYKN